jgi:hypothetical protein
MATQGGDDIREPEADTFSDVRVRVVLLVGVAALVLLVVILVVILPTPFRAGGDPGNATYARLRLATRAIPSTAVNVHREAAEPTGWTAGCPEFGSASHVGWTRVYLSATFDEPGVTTSQVLDEVGAALTHQGWIRHDEPTGPGRGPSPHWTLRPRRGRTADLFLFPANGSSESNWFMGVSWQPPGPIGTNCP